MGLEIAWSMGIKKLILESDSTITVNALTQDRDKIDANHAFIVIGFTCLFLYFKNVFKNEFFLIFSLRQNNIFDVFKSFLCADVKNNF